jgi:hypothetical protein
MALSKQAYGQWATVKVDADERCACPVCRGKAILALSELAEIPGSGIGHSLEPANLHVGVTGMVVPAIFQLARWFRVPLPPKYSVSKLHGRAHRDGLVSGAITAIATFGLQALFFSPSIATISIALFVGLLVGAATHSLVKRAAIADDIRTDLEASTRTATDGPKIAGCDKLFYCPGCGMVHDRETSRALPWYSMHQLLS